MDEKEMDFGELSHDENFKQRILGFSKDVKSASEVVKQILEHNYEELSIEDKLRRDLFLAFAINSYFWMYLRLQGIDANQHEIKNQINRVREYMKRSTEVYEKKTIMPRIDQGAAKRFVKSGLWTPKSSEELKQNSGDNSGQNSKASKSQVPAKRRKVDGKE